MLRFEIINSDEMDKYIGKPNVLVIDIRESDEYERKHIKSAVNIPMSKLERNYGKLPRNKILIFYCESGGTAILAAKELYDRGYVTKALIGGIKEYTGKALTSYNKK